MTIDVRRFLCPQCHANVAVPDESVESYCGTYFLNHPEADINDFTAIGCPHCRAAIPFRAEVRP